jgi:5,10-methylenetetrahydromethanopterin reductase
MSCTECAKLASLCEASGFSHFWVADEIWYRDPWQVLSVCVSQTKTIRLGPGVTHIYLRNPAFIAQSLATLDELCNGRTMCGISIGNQVMLTQCRVKPENPMEALREAITLIRILLKGESVTTNGKHFSYDGVNLKIRPHQSNLPIYVGAKAGPRSFELAGEIGDGLIATDVYTSSRAKEVLDSFKLGLKRSGRESLFNDLDRADWILLGIDKDSKRAKDLVRPIVSLYLPTQFPAQLKAYGIDLTLHTKISKLQAQGKSAEAISLTNDDVVEKFSIAGTPDEVIEKLKSLNQAGISHFVLAPVDSSMIESLGYGKSSKIVDKSLVDSIRLIAEEVMPAFR